MKDRLSIYVVDDEPMAIEYFKYLLNTLGDTYTLVGSSTSSMGACLEIPKLKPDVIFTDIVMPVMDGVELAQKLLESDDYLIYMLTSYKDFEYAKKSVQIGVSDYVLKNDLSEESLDRILKEAEIKLNHRNKSNHLILEHNIKSFLMSENDISEDLSYKNKPLQRYAILQFRTSPEIILKHRSQRIIADIDCFSIEDIDWPTGLKCSCFISMGDNEYLAIFFIEETEAEGERLLYKAADKILDELENYGGQWLCLISDIKRHFFDLQGAYMDMINVQQYLYMFNEQRIVFSNDIDPDNYKGYIPDDDIKNVINELSDSNDQCIVHAKELFEDARKHLNIWEYTDMLKDVYKGLKNILYADKLSENSLLLSDRYNNTTNAERAMLNCIEMLYKDKLNKANKAYSEHIRKALTFIEKHYSEDLSVEIIADSIGVSEGHLRRLFNQELGSNVVQYLKNYRIDKAKMLLEYQDEPLDTIWKKTGFASAQYFSYVFKQKEGMLPKEYMKRGHRI